MRLVKNLNQLTRRQLRLCFEQRRFGDMLHALADISAARECLGYEIKVIIVGMSAQDVEVLPLAELMPASLGLPMQCHSDRSLVSF